LPLAGRRCNLQKDTVDSTLDAQVQGARPLVQRLKQEYRPTEVWLFGSRARGTATADSDWDFLVVVPDETDDDVLDPLRAWRVQKEARVVADIVVCKEHDFRADRDTVNTLGYVVAREGIRVFERGAPDRQ
jgi:predicted nucleotidyltransferase